jgi:hypothetical protein
MMHLGVHRGTWRGGMAARGGLSRAVPQSILLSAPTRLSNSELGKSVHVNDRF